MDQLRDRMRKDPKTMLIAAWMKTFNLPPNDERLLRLSEREAAEQVLLAQAWEAEVMDRAKTRQPPALQGDFVGKPDVTVKRGADAAKVADSAHLTGNAEFDAVELRETSRAQAFPPGFLD